MPENSRDTSLKPDHTEERQNRKSNRKVYSHFILRAGDPRRCRQYRVESLGQDCVVQIPLWVPWECTALYDVRIMNKKVHATKVNKNWRHLVLLFTTQSGPWTSSASIPWEFFRISNSWVPLQTYRNTNSASLCLSPESGFNILFRRFLRQLKFRANGCLGSSLKAWKGFVFQVKNCYHKGEKIL